MGSPFGSYHNAAMCGVCWFIFILAIVGVSVPVSVIDPGADGGLRVVVYLADRCKNFPGEQPSCVSNKFGARCGAEADRIGAAMAFAVLGIMANTIPMFACFLRVKPVQLHANFAIDSLIFFSLVSSAICFLIAWPVTLSIHTSSMCGIASFSENDHGKIGGSSIVLLFVWLLLVAAAVVEKLEQAELLYPASAQFGESCFDALNTVRSELLFRCPRCCSCLEKQSARSSMAEDGCDTAVEDDSSPAPGVADQGSSYGAI